MSTWVFLSIVLGSVSLSLTANRIERLSPLWESIKTTVFEGYEVRYGNGTVLSAIRKIEVTQDSNIVIGEHLSEDNQLILTCTAWFPTEWFYSGDGVPAFTTNTTVEYWSSSGQSMRRNETTGAKRYKASLFLGYSRKLHSDDSGRYNCLTKSPDIDTKYYKLSAFYYIYVPSSKTLFTRQGGDSIAFDQEKSPARIPCSVTNPKSAVSIQKFENGQLRCIPPEAMFYHPISGFYPQNDIAGTYICTAAFNKTVQILHFTLYPMEPRPANPGYISHEEQLDIKSTEGQALVCSDTTCGKSAECFVAESDTFSVTVGRSLAPQCKCPYGYFGDPYVECHRSMDWYV